MCLSKILRKILELIYLPAGSVEILVLIENFNKGYPEIFNDFSLELKICDFITLI